MTNSEEVARINNKNKSASAFWQYFGQYVQIGAEEALKSPEIAEL
jgi:hypothetical protein